MNDQKDSELVVLNATNIYGIIKKTFAKRKLILVLALILGIGYGFYKHRNFEEKYVASMLMQSNILGPKSLEALISPLEYMAGANRVEFCSLLKIDPTTFTNPIYGLRLESLERVPFENSVGIDTSTIFSIEVEVGNPRDILIMENGLYSYLDAIDYVIKKIDFHKDRLQYQNKMLDQKLQDYKNVAEKLSCFGAKELIGEKARLNELKYKNDVISKSLVSFEKISGFTIHRHKESGLVKQIILSSATVFFCTIILLAFIEIITYLNRNS